jgi:hypothetical protein
MAIVAGILLCLTGGGLGGCASFTERQATLQASPDSLPTVAPQTTRTTTQIELQAPPQSKTQTGSRNNRYARGQSFTCQTQNYFAQITWQSTQPYLKFGRSPSDISSTSIATEDRAADGSVTYTSRKEQTIIVRFLTSGGCNIRVFDANGNVRINEAGQVGGNSTSTTKGYWDGYNRGFKEGERDGRKARLYNYGYNPNFFFQSGSQTGNEDYDNGFRDGFFKGFDEGYNVAVNPSPLPDIRPLPEPLPDPWIPDPGIPASW